MKSRKSLRTDLLRLCAQPGPEDGLDPRDFFRKPEGKVANRKALQLCGQVARTLNCILSGECGDDVLRDVVVTAVEPVPNTTRLLVTVSLAASGTGLEPAAVLERLHGASGMLRSEIAAVIHRKRTPELVFRVLTRADV